MKILLKELVVGPKFQNRCNLDQSVVDEYSEAISNGVEFPPITVFFDSAEYFLVDGYHRYFAHQKAEIEEIECEVLTGTQRDAILYACGANAIHGLKRSNSDKRKAVLTLLNDDEWKSWSDHQIAEVCKVSHVLVHNLKKEFLTININSDNPQNLTTQMINELSQKDETQSENGNNRAENLDPNIRTYTNKYGQTAQMNVANIGRKKPEPKEAEDEEYDDDYEKIIPYRGFRGDNSDRDLLDLRNELLTVLSAYSNVKSEKCREAIAKITNYLNSLKT